MTVSDVPRTLGWQLNRLWLEFWAEQVVRLALRGLCVGLSIALGGALALVLQAGVVSPQLLFAPVIAGLGAGVLLGALRPPNRLHSARRADARLGLEDRLGTASELISRGVSGPVELAQLGDAARALTANKQGRPSWSRYSSVGREVAITTALGLLLLGVLRFEGRGAVLLSRPVDHDGVAQGPGEERQLLVASPQPERASSLAGEARTSDALRALDDLARARESGALSEARVGQELDRIEGDLRQRAAAARQQGENLDRLAQALGQVSAGKAAAEGIQQGDYARAADQLRELGRESDQLSPDAKSQLAQSLRRAASESGTDRSLADRERRAADALASKDYSAAQSALGALGDELQRSAARGEDSGALAEALQRVGQERAAQGEPDGSASGSLANGASGPTGRQTLGDPGNAGQQAGSQAGAGTGDQAGSGSGASVGDVPDAPRGATAASGSEGSSVGGLGEAAPKLEVVGRPAEVPARPASPVGGVPTDRPTADEQVVGATGSASGEAGQPAAAVRAGGQIERIVVPGDQRSVVRDYFARRSVKGTP